MKAKTTERGWIGHFICGSYCNFRRNTLIEHKKKRIVVSTVGAMKLRDSEEYKTIGYERYYETMAFKAKLELGRYWDADVTKEVSFVSDWQIDKIDEESDELANNMHDAVVREICKRLEKK